MTIAGIPYQNPLRYTGPNANLVPIVVFSREPTITDVKYRIGTVVIIGKDPSSGTTGELWYLSEFNSSGQAVWLQLLTGAASPGIDSITTDEGAPAVEPDGNGNVNIVGGTGINVTGQGPGDTVTITATGVGLTWNVVTGGTQAITASNGYFANNGGGVTFTLPATATVGDFFAISGINAGGFTIAQNGGQNVRMGNQITTTGITGSLASAAIGDSVYIVCYATNNNFIVLNSMGNITVT